MTTNASGDLTRTATLQVRLGMSTLAADFNGDGQITAMDALGILLHVGQFAGAAAPEWLFVEDGTELRPLDTLTGPGLAPVPQLPVPAAIPVEALDSDMHIAVVGILRGDMIHYPEAL